MNGDTCENYEDYLTAEDIKRMTKIAKCPHNEEFLIFIKCKSCSYIIDEKNHSNLHNKIIEILKNEGNQGISA